MAGGNGDWIFQVGVSTDEASAAVDAFVRKTELALNSIKSVNLNVSSTLGDQNKILGASKERLATEQQIQKIQNRAAVDAANTEAKVANATAKRLAAEKEIARLNAGGRPGGSTSLRDISGIASGNAAALKKQTDAFDMLGRIGGNAVFKFVEYELVMQAFNATVHEFMDSVNQAAGVQLEQTLQGLYNSTLDTNAALKDATTIAKRWGSDIMDVQQAIGLWTKQTHDLTAATYLANEAEMMHRASGIDSQEVYRMSIAMVQQLGLTLGQLPSIYDQVANASLKLAVPLKAMPGGGGGSNMEAMKEIFEGLSESSATLKAMGFDSAGIIAVVSNQVQAMGEHGKEAAKNLTSMFAALEGKGHGRETFEKIMGPFKTAPDDIHRTDEMLQKMQDHAKQLFQAYANGDLGVRPQQFETLQTFEASLQRIKQLRDEIAGNNSKGTLKLIADTEMNTLLGQLDRLKASFQEFNLAIGRELLPSATNFVKFLNSSMMPALSAHSSEIVGTAKILGELGAAYMIVLGIQKGWASGVTANQQALLSQRMELNANNVILGEYGATEFKTAEGVAAATAQMEREQQALQMLADKLKVVEWETGEFQAKCEALGVSMDDVTAIAGTRMPTAFEAMASGARAAAGAIMTMAAPLAIITTAMNMIDAWNQGGDGQKAAQYGLDEYLTDRTGRDENGKKGAFHFEPLHNITAVRARGNKDYEALTGIVNQAVTGSETWDPNKKAFVNSGTDWAPGSLMGRIKAEYDVMNRANAKGDEHAYTVARQQLAQLAQLQYAKHHMDVADNPAMPTSGLDIKVPGTGAIEEPTYNKPNTKGQPKKATEQQIAAEAVNKRKADAMSLISHYRDIASAAATEVQTQKDLAKWYGTTHDTLVKLTAAYGAQQAAMRNGQGAAENEIKQLQQQKTHLANLVKHHGGTLDANGNVHGGDKSSAIYAEAKAWRMANEAIVKAQGAIEQYKAKRGELADMAKHDIAEMQDNMLAGNIGRGLGQTFKKPDDIDKYVRDTLKTLNVTKDPTQQLALAKTDTSLMSGLLASVGKISDPQVKQALLDTINDALQTIGNTSDNAQSKIDAITKSIGDLTDSLSKSNTDNLDYIFNVSKDSVDYANAITDAHKKYLDQMAEIDKLEKDATPEQRTQLELLRQQVTLEQQLSDAAARVKEIRGSDEYRAVNSALDSFGKTSIDTNLKDMFSASKKNGGKQNEFQKLLTSMFQPVMDANWSKQAQSITDKIFGVQKTVDPQKQAADIQLTAAQMQLQAAKGKAGPTSGSHMGPLDQNIGPNADRVADQDPDTANQGAAVAVADATHADDNTAYHAQTADSTTQTKNYLTGGGFVTDMQTILMPMIAMMGSSNSGGAGGRGVAGAIATGAGMFLSSKVGQNWLSGKDGKSAQQAGNAMQGIGYGEEFGQMQGGGSHTTWGEVGGAIGGYFGGPLGSMAGAFIGSLFGHADDPSKMPDKYDTQHYGQFVTDMNGNTQSFNGTTISAEAQYEGANNESSQIAKFISTLSPAKMSKLGPDELATLNKLKALNPTMSSSGFSIANEKDGVFTLGSGQKISVTDYENLIGAFQKLEQSANGAATALAPIMSINAYGAGAGYFGPNPYNMPGLNSSEATAMRNSGYSSLPSTSYQQTSPYGAPGVAGFGSNDPRTMPIGRSIGNALSAAINVTTPVILDGKVIAQIVNAINAQLASTQGKWGT